MTSLTGSRGPTGGNQGNGRRTGDVVPTGFNLGQLQQFTPEQQNLFGDLFSHVGQDSYTSRLARGDQDLFNEIEAPAFRQFSGIQSGIASRFSGMGSFGARNSSGFQNTQTAAGVNFAQDLQANRQGLQRQAIKDLMGMSEMLLNQRPQERFLEEKQPKKRSFLQEFLLASAPGLVEAGVDLGKAGIQALGA